MPARFTGKLCQFLFEHLERGTFGERLLWLDRRSGVFQLAWKHGNRGSTMPHRDCAVFMAWDQYKARRPSCKPLDAKQRFRAAMDKMKLQLLQAWGLHERKQGYQIRKFPRADLDHLLKKFSDTRATSRSRCDSVNYDSASEADTDSTATEGSSSELPKDKSLLNNERNRSCDTAQPQGNTLALAAESEKNMASLQEDTSAEEETQDGQGTVAVVYYDEDVAVDFTDENDYVNVTQDGTSKVEPLICMCSQASRCLWCTVLEYSDPPVNSVFRFDINVPPDTALTI